MTNLLPNGSFENGWADKPAYATMNQEPSDWRLLWLQPGMPLRSAGYAGPDDAPVYLCAETAPECVHKHNDQLPPNEQLGGADALVLDGEWTYKVFSMVKPFGVRLDTLVTGLEPGRRVVLEVPVQVHQQGDGSPGAAVWRVGLGEHLGPWLTFGDFEDRRWLEFGIDGIVPENGAIYCCVNLESRSLGGIDFFMDNVRLRYLDDDSESVDYVVVVNLLPQDTTIDEFGAALEDRFDSRETWVQSADDAARLTAPGLPGSLVRAYAPERWTQGDIVEYLLDHGAPYVETVSFPGGDPPVTPPEPPPPSGEPDPYPLRSRNLIGLHSSFTGALSWPYITDARPTIQKFFAAGDAYQASQHGPGIVSIWRKFVGNEEGRIDEKPTIRESARWYLDQYSREIDTAAHNMGLTVSQLLGGITAIESLNETIPTFNPGQLQRAVEFDVCFDEERQARYGDAVQAVLLNGAIGNPHESEVHYLLPAAASVYAHGGFLGYHPYWTANGKRSFLSEHWEYHAGRWMDWDVYFRSQGVYPRYSLGEAGVVYAHDGVSFNSGLGWRACGDIERYLDDIDEFNHRLLAWNAAHANRCAGATLFAAYQHGWDNFLLGDGEIRLLIEWSQTL